jgi:hypothetical protein
MAAEEIISEISKNMIAQKAFTSVLYDSSKRIESSNVQSIKNDKELQMMYKTMVESNKKLVDIGQKQLEEKIKGKSLKEQVVIVNTLEDMAEKLKKTTDDLASYQEKSNELIESNFKKLVEIEEKKAEKQFLMQNKEYSGFVKKIDDLVKAKSSTNNIDIITSANEKIVNLKEKMEDIKYDKRELLKKALDRRKLEGYSIERTKAASKAEQQIKRESIKVERQRKGYLGTLESYGVTEKSISVGALNEGSEGKEGKTSLLEGMRKSVSEGVKSGYQGVRDSEFGSVFKTLAMFTPIGMAYTIGKGFAKAFGIDKIFGLIGDLAKSAWATVKQGIHNTIFATATEKLALYQTKKQEKLDKENLKLLKIKDKEDQKHAKEQLTLMKKQDRTASKQAKDTSKMEKHLIGIEHNTKFNWLKDKLVFLIPFLISGFLLFKDKLHGIWKVIAGLALWFTGGHLLKGLIGGVVTGVIGGIGKLISILGKSGKTTTVVAKGAEALVEAGGVATKAVGAGAKAGTVIAEGAGVATKASGVTVKGAGALSKALGVAVKGLPIVGVVLSFLLDMMEAAKMGKSVPQVLAAGMVGNMDKNLGTGSKIMNLLGQVLKYGSLGALIGAPLAGVGAIPGAIVGGMLGMAIGSGNMFLSSNAGSKVVRDAKLGSMKLLDDIHTGAIKLRAFVLGGLGDFMANPKKYLGPVAAGLEKFTLSIKDKAVAIGGGIKKWSEDVSVKSQDFLDQIFNPENLKTNFNNIRKGFDKMVGGFIKWSVDLSANFDDWLNSTASKAIELWDKTVESVKNKGVFETIKDVGKSLWDKATGVVQNQVEEDRAFLSQKEKSKGLLDSYSGEVNAILNRVKKEASDKNIPQDIKDRSIGDYQTQIKAIYEKYSKTAQTSGWDSQVLNTATQIIKLTQDNAIKEISSLIVGAKTSAPNKAAKTAMDKLRENEKYQQYVSSFSKTVTGGATGDYGFEKNKEYFTKLTAVKPELTEPKSPRVKHVEVKNTSVQSTNVNSTNSNVVNNAHSSMHRMLVEKAAGSYGSI